MKPNEKRLKTVWNSRTKKKR